VGELCRWYSIRALPKTSFGLRAQHVPRSYGLLVSNNSRGKRAPCRLKDHQFYSQLRETLNLEKPLQAEIPKYCWGLDEIKLSCIFKNRSCSSPRIPLDTDDTLGKQDLASVLPLTKLRTEPHDTVASEVEGSRADGPMGTWFARRDLKYCQCWTFRPHPKEFINQAGPRAKSTLKLKLFVPDNEFWPVMWGSDSRLLVGSPTLPTPCPPRPLSHSPTSPSGTVHAHYRGTSLHTDYYTRHLRQHTNRTARRATTKKQTKNKTKTTLTHTGLAVPNLQGSGWLCIRGEQFRSQKCRVTRLPLG
jgi:hypothetical protein